MSAYVFGLVVMLAAVVYAPAAPEIYAVTPEHEERLIELDRLAIDEAYKKHVEALFATWMKDDRDQPARAQRGAQQARKAYVQAMRGIELRERRPR